MSRHVFSSEVVTTSYARRDIRSRADITSPLQDVVAALNPLIRGYGSRGKVSRDQMRATVRQLVAALKSRPNMISINVLTNVPPPSSQESYDICTIFPAPHSDRLIAFLPLCIRVSRKSAEVIVVKPTFMVSDHALARFMQRTEQPLSAFYGHILQPMRFASILGDHIMRADYQEFALPFAGGLMFGKMEFYPDERPTTCIRIYDESGCRDRFINNNLTRSHAMLFEVNTFIDHDSLTVGKSRISEKFAAIDAVLGETITKIFNIRMFNRPERADEEDIHSVFAAGFALLEEPEWEALFARRAARLG